MGTIKNDATITKTLTFDAAHYLFNPIYTREENISMFHKCCLYKEDGAQLYALVLGGPR